MHEFSLATNVFEIVEQSVPPEKSNLIESVEIEIGSMSGVDVDAFVFALNEIKKELNKETYNFKILEIISKAQCKLCNTIFEPENYFVLCPKCNTQNCTITKGKELNIKRITLKN